MQSPQSNSAQKGTVCVCVYTHWSWPVLGAGMLVGRCDQHGENTVAGMEA
jgi:hypothetical protein